MDDVIAVHKQVERALRCLTVIAERTREAIVVLDLNGVIQFLNAACALMHGYERPDELIGKQVSVLHAKEQMKTDVIPFIEEAKQKGQFAGRLAHIRKDGTPFFTEMLMVVFNDDAGKASGLVGFAADLTEKERTKDELRRHRRHLEEIKQQIEVLEATNSMLQSQAAEHEQARQKLKQQTVKLSATNERLRQQICEHEHVKDELEQHRDKLEQRLRKHTDELTAARAQLQDEITRRKKQEQYLKQQTDAIKAAGAHLQAQIDELSAGSPLGKSGLSEATDSVEAAPSLADNEKTVLENVFRQNIVLQKTKLDGAAEEDS